MLPSFRNGDYDSGMVAGVRAVHDILESGEIPPDVAADGGDGEGFPIGLILFFGVIGVYFVGAWLIHRASRRCPECGRVGLKIDSTALVSRSMGVSTYEDTYVCEKCGAVIKRRRSSRSSGRAVAAAAAEAPLSGASAVSAAAVWAAEALVAVSAAAASAAEVQARAGDSTGDIETMALEMHRSAERSEMRE